jgi:hypothetical protein
MSYNKQTFVNGDSPILDADTLNNMENAISNLDSNPESYNGLLDDFNKALTPGVYQFNTSTLNFVSPCYGVVRVTTANGQPYVNGWDWIWQTVYTTSANSEPPHIWIRSKTNTDAWSAWKQVI